MTLDGRIAKNEMDPVAWGSPEDKSHLRQELDEHDLFLMGRHTWEVSKELLKSQSSLVLTRGVSGWETENTGLAWVNPEGLDLRSLLAEKGFSSVAVLGGSQIYAFCLQNGLVDEVALTLEPFFLGQGLSLLSPISLDLDQNAFSLVSTKVLNQSGTLLLRYKKRAKPEA
jgi:dihydrofolate reductase